MADKRLSDFQADVRHKIRHFLWDERNRKQARAHALREIIAKGWRACLFGGVVRDVVVKSPWVKMRDIDIVVADVSVDELKSAFGASVIRQTRFGGLTLCFDDWYFDVWPLESTWGCRFFPEMSNSFSVLPKTTFFSVEAIAVELRASSGVPRTIFQERFLESVSKRTIFLNLPENPFPALCIVRAFTLARKLDFALSAELVRHLAGWAEKFSSSQLEEVMFNHYGQCIFSSNELKGLVRQLLDHALSGADDSMRVRLGTQLTLPFYPTEPADSLIADEADFETSVV